MGAKTKKIAALLIKAGIRGSQRLLSNKQEVACLSAQGHSGEAATFGLMQMMMQPQEA